MRDSTGLTATHNQSWGNCIGIFALNSGAGAAPGDLPAGDYKITNKQGLGQHHGVPAGWWPSWPLQSGYRSGRCPRRGRAGQHGEQQPVHPSLGSAQGGIVVFSTAFPGGADPTNNTMAGNNLHNNTPADIFWDGTGTGNMVTTTPV